MVKSTVPNLGSLEALGAREKTGLSTATTPRGFRKVAIDAQGEYEWSQTPEVATIYIKLPMGVTEHDIDIKIASQRLRVGVKGKSRIIKAELFDKVDKDACTWRLIEFKYLEIDLHKTTHRDWQSILRPEKSEDDSWDGIEHQYQSIDWLSPMTPRQL